MPRLIGILGGTFDPIHYGHIRLALEALDQLDLDQVRLVPLKIPAHKTNPIASITCRLEMIKLATNDIAELCLDLREIESQEVSYTINTLKSLRREFRDQALYLIIGNDAFNKLDYWKEWQSLLDYTHIVVANRTGVANNTALPKLHSWIKKHQTKNRDLLKDHLNGYLYFIKIPPLAISSSIIRSLIAQQKNINGLLPGRLFSYIKKNNLYLKTT